METPEGTGRDEPQPGANWNFGFFTCGLRHLLPYACGVSGKKFTQKESASVINSLSNRHEPTPRGSISRYRGLPSCPTFVAPAYSNILHWSRSAYRIHIAVYPEGRRLMCLISASNDPPDQKFKSNIIINPAWRGGCQSRLILFPTSSPCALLTRSSG